MPQATTTSPNEGTSSSTTPRRISPRIGTQTIDPATGPKKATTIGVAT